MSIERKVAIITGASQGLGAELVRAYRNRSYRVVAKRKDVPAPRFARATPPKPIAFPARGLPPKLGRKRRAGTVAVAELGPLLAEAWAQTAAPRQTPRAVKPRRRRRTN